VASSFGPGTLKLFMLKGALMTIESPPPHGLYLKWGKFQIGAFGIPAVLTVLAAMVLVALGRAQGWW
jgi:hypothetical protein